MSKEKEKDNTDELNDKTDLGDVPSKVMVITRPASPFSEQPEYFISPATKKIPDRTDRFKEISNQLIKEKYQSIVESPECSERVNTRSNLSCAVKKAIAKKSFAETATQVTRHAKRGRLTVDDFDKAMKFYGLEAFYNRYYDQETLEQLLNVIEGSELAPPAAPPATLLAAPLPAASRAASRAASPWAASRAASPWAASRAASWAASQAVLVSGTVQIFPGITESQQVSLSTILEAVTVEDKKDIRRIVLAMNNLSVASEFPALGQYLLQTKKTSLLGSSSRKLNEQNNFFTYLLNHTSPKSEKNSSTCSTSIPLVDKQKGEESIDQDEKSDTSLQSLKDALQAYESVQVKPGSEHSSSASEMDEPNVCNDTLCVDSDVRNSVKDFSKRVTQTSKHSMPRHRQIFVMSLELPKKPAKNKRRSYKLEDMQSESSDSDYLGVVCIENDSIDSSEFSDDCTTGTKWDDIQSEISNSDDLGVACVQSDSISSSELSDDCTTGTKWEDMQSEISNSDYLGVVCVQSDPSSSSKLSDDCTTNIKKDLRSHNSTPTRGVPNARSGYQDSFMGQCSSFGACIFFGIFAEIHYHCTHLEKHGKYLVEVVGKTISSKPKHKQKAKPNHDRKPNPKPIQGGMLSSSLKCSVSSTESADATNTPLVTIKVPEAADATPIVNPDNRTKVAEATDNTSSSRVTVGNKTTFYSADKFPPSKRKSGGRSVRVRIHGEVSHKKYIETTVTSRIAITPSVLEVYRGLFQPICNRNKGLTCLRHADIPGLSKSFSFPRQECSHLNFITFKDDQFALHPETYSGKPSRYESETRGHPLSSDKLQKPLQPEGNNIPNAGDSHKIVPEVYKIDESYVQEMTKLLHALNFPAILAANKLVFELIELPDSSRHNWNVSLIPPFFITGLSCLKIGSENGLISRSDHIDKARRIFSECAKLGLASSKPEDSALCYLYLGDIHFLSHSYQDACTYYKNAISKFSAETVASIFRMVPPSKSTIYSKYGSSLRRETKIVDAIQQYKIAIKEANTTKDRLAANTSLGNLYQAVGENTSALRHYEQSVELSEMLRDYVSLGWAHGNMGNAYLGLFQKDKALFHLHKALDLTLEYERTPQAIGRAYNNLGTAYQSLGDLDKAQEHYTYAHNQAEFGNDKAGKCRVCGNMGNILMLRKQYKEAIEQYSEVLSNTKDGSTESTAHHNRGCAYYEWGETKMLELYGEHMGKQGEGDPVASEPIVYLHGADFKGIIGRMKPRIATKTIAEYFTNGCKDLCEVVKFHESHLKNIKGSSKGLTLSVSLFETNSRTFHRLQDCYVSLGEYTKALLVAEQSRARTLGELMLKRKVWQLQKSLSSPMEFDDIVATVASTEHPVFYLSYTGARLLGWVFISEGSEVKMNMFEVPLKDDQFKGKSFDYHLRYSLTEVLVERNFEMYREVGDYNEDTSAPVQTLYNLIADPLLAVLRKSKVESLDKLIVITDSYTALLPFSSLHDLKNDVFLGDLFCFQLMPSFLTMGILNQLPDTNIVHLPTDTHNLCIVGNPNIPQFKLNDEIWNLGKLPHAKREAEAVAHIMKATPLLEAQATKSAVLMRIMNSKIIHLATHGSASSGFLAFGMVTTSMEKVVHSQGVLLYPEEVENLDINPALVVLSSCDSGRGAVKADGIQGMARAFILAGAQAVLTTLWRVPDESAAVFMEFFYQYMMDGLESTRALQKAILSIRCFSKYSQYIHWSGYQLTGRDIYLKYTAPEVMHILDKRLGKKTVFSRLQYVKVLESNLVNATCYPTNIQILEASPGLDAHEIVIDFIHNSYNHFTGGIYWINCEHDEFVSGSLKCIEKVIGGPLEKLQLSELHQCLLIFDGISELPSSESLLQLMANRYTHCIILYQHYISPEDFIRSMDHKLLRGSKFHHVETLSMIQSTQRIVYALQQVEHFCPKSIDQMIIKKISNYTSGSPILVNIVSQLLQSHFSNSSQNLLLEDFERSITKYIVDESFCSSSSSSTSSDSSSPSSVSSRKLSSSVSDSLTSISILAPECRDEWDTPGSYDSWDFLAGLLSASHFDPEARLLLDCLSHLGCGPVPHCIVSLLSIIITKMSGRTHLSGSLLTQLMDKGFVKVYPSPVVIHSNTKQETDIEFIYVPKFVSDYILKELECPDKAIALSTCFCTLSHKALPYSSVIVGTLKSLIKLYEVNADLMGETCYGEVYRLYLSHI